MEVVREGHCMECGYDLTGLPRVGNCPECGNAYDDYTRTGFDSGNAERQRRMDRRVARARTGCFGLLAVMPMGLALLLSLTGASKPAAVFSIATVFTLFFGLAAVVSFLYERPE